MLEIITVIIDFISLILVFVLSALPLHLAVKVLRGKTTIFKTVIVTFIAGLIVTVIRSKFEVWGGIIAFLAVGFLYREIFRLKWWKTSLIWILQAVFIMSFYIIVEFALRITGF